MFAVGNWKLATYDRIFRLTLVKEDSVARRTSGLDQRHFVWRERWWDGRRFSISVSFTVSIPLCQYAKIIWKGNALRSAEGARRYSRDFNWENLSSSVRFVTIVAKRSRVLAVSLRESRTRRNSTLVVARSVLLKRKPATSTNTTLYGSIFHCLVRAIRFLNAYADTANESPTAIAPPLALDCRATNIPPSLHPFVRVLYFFSFLRISRFRERVCASRCATPIIVLPIVFPDPLAESLTYDGERYCRRSNVILLVDRRYEGSISYETCN